MKPSEILKVGLEFLETKGWTQGAYARGADDVVVDTLEEATCACGIGAIRLAAFKTVNLSIAGVNKYPYAKAYDCLNAVTDGWWVGWQDMAVRTFSEIKAKFLEAIALAEKDEAINAQI